MLNDKTKKRYLILIAIAILFFSYLIFTTQAEVDNLANQLKGKILLQVEQNGEAWYVNPVDEQRYYMGRPIDAFNLMKKLGVGITNKDIKKISIANSNLSGSDIDKDGLSDLFEDAVGTNKNKVDSDNDGYSDRDEIFNNYNPNSDGKLNIDNNFADKQKGKIFLQVEQNGEAWYIYPDDGKRYFLGRPADAFSIMRILGLGITDSDLEKITINAGITGLPDYESIQETENKDDDINSDIDQGEEYGKTENNGDGEIAKIAFEDNFKSCESDTKEEDITPAIVKAYRLVYKYEIIGYQGDLCEVKTKLIETPNKEWLNQEMICGYDNSQNWDAAKQNQEHCSGDLYDLMIKR